MGTIAITGSASGIGKATRLRLERDGHRVIGVDLHDAEVIADLSNPAGRAAMIAGVTAAADGALDGLVAGAGIASTHDPGLVLAVNYFGAVATLVGLRSLLANGRVPSAVAISSNSTTTQAGIDLELVEACLRDDETAARTLAEGRTGRGHAAAKLALARWVRRHAVTADWIGAGVRLNAIAPGLIETPLTAPMMQMITVDLKDTYPIPRGRHGQPEDIAGLLAFLLSPEAEYFCGSFIVMDGGTDAALRADDWPSARPS